jgi:hypothetical protein
MEFPEEANSLKKSKLLTNLTKDKHKKITNTM